MSTQLLRDRLPDILTGLKEISLVYLFGSQIEGNLGPMSDYDLGVLIDRTADERQVHARFTHELACALQTDRIDVVLLNRVPIELAYAIVAQGRVLYQRDVATRVEYEAQVMNRYGDYLPVLRAQRDDVLRGDEDAARIHRSRVHRSRVHRYRAALGRTRRTLGQIAATQRQEPESVDHEAECSRV